MTMGLKMVRVTPTHGSSAPDSNPDSYPDCDPDTTPDKTFFHVHQFSAGVRYCSMKAVYNLVSKTRRQKVISKNVLVQGSQLYTFLKYK